MSFWQCGLAWVRKFWISQSVGFTTCSYIPPNSHSEDSRRIFCGSDRGGDGRTITVKCTQNIHHKEDLPSKEKDFTKAEEEHFSHSSPLYPSCIILIILVFLGLHLQHVEVPRRGIESTTQQRPKLLQWQHQIPNLLHHKRTLNLTVLKSITYCLKI